MFAQDFRSTMIERVSCAPKMSDSADRLAEMVVIYWIHLHNSQIIPETGNDIRSFLFFSTLLFKDFNSACTHPVTVSASFHLDNFHAISNRFQFNWPAAVPFGEGIWWLWAFHFKRSIYHTSGRRFRIRLTGTRWVAFIGTTLKLCSE